MVASKQARLIIRQKGKLKSRRMYSSKYNDKSVFRKAHAWLPENAHTLP